MIREKFLGLRDALLDRHLERYDEVELSLVAVLCRYHALLIGPPGTAKSMLTRDLCRAFAGARYFDHLMNKFTTPEKADLPSIDLDELRQAQREVTDVGVPEGVIDMLYEIRSGLNLEGIIVSDRRFNQSMRALRAMAWMDGREVATDDDFRILVHMMWTNLVDIKRVTRVILSHTNPLDLEADEIIDMVDEVSGELSAALLDCQQKGVKPRETLVGKGIEWFNKLNNIADDLRKLKKRAEAQGKSTNRITQAMDRTARVARTVSDKTMGIELDRED